MPVFYRFQNRVDNKTPAVLYIDDYIGFMGVEAAQFRQQLEAVQGDELEISVNSPGGDVFAGLGIYHMLRHWASQGARTLTSRVTGLAGSIAGIIFLAGDKRQMPRNTFALIHPVSGMAFGGVKEMRETAQIMETVQDGLRNIYVERMGLALKKVEAMMGKETLLTAQECQECGFSTELTDATELQARFDLSRTSVPKEIARLFMRGESAAQEAGQARPPIAGSPPEPARQLCETQSQSSSIFEMARKEGLGELSAWVALSFSNASEARDAIQHARQVLDLCAIAGHAPLAAGFIKSRKDISEVRNMLLAQLEQEDIHIDNEPVSRGGGVGDGRKDPCASMDTRAIWEKHLKRN